MTMTVSQLKEERRMGTAHVYQSTLKRISYFAGISPVWLRAFQEYLLSCRLHWNTVSIYMRILRATYFQTVDDSLAPYQPRLFKGVYTGTKVTVKRAVNEEVFRKLDIPVEDKNLESTYAPAVPAPRNAVCGHCLPAALQPA